MGRKYRIGLIALLTIVLFFSAGCLEKNDNEAVRETLTEQPEITEQDINELATGTVTVGGVIKEYYFDNGSQQCPRGYEYYNCTYYASREFHKIAPPPGITWLANASEWSSRAAENGWVTETDPRKAKIGAVVVYDSHVQIVRDVQEQGIVVQGMNEGWGGSHDPLDPSHSFHSEYGFKTYIGYVYKYFLTYGQVANGYYFNSFQGYILPVRSDSADGSSGKEVLGVEAEPQEPSLIADIADKKDLIGGLDADYYIDYENGTIPIGDLPIGARVVDPSWHWEFRRGNNYSDIGKVIPIIWIVVAKDHYDGLEPHVTLLTEDLIGKYSFDNSTNRGHSNSNLGYNHWGESGTANATLGLRPWLNSTGIHLGEGFYLVFSEHFKRAVLKTTLPNIEWQNGSSYSTNDFVFIPSTTELGDTVHSLTYPIGSAYPYFSGADYPNFSRVDIAKRIALLNGVDHWYYTRSPASNWGNCLRKVDGAGLFYYSDANSANSGIRPALNLKSGTLVSEIRN